LKKKATQILLNNKNITLKPWWITGIVDSEGNFSINYNTKSKKMTFAFKVTQNKESLAILTYLKEYFKIGNINIDNINTNGYKYIVSNRKDLINVIFPHFDNYPLQGSKYLDYLDFKRSILLLNDSSDNIDRVLSIKSNMNKSRSYEERWNYLKNKEFNIMPEWIQAFIDGEGTFQCRIAETMSRCNTYIAVNPTLEIAQNSHDVFVLNAIIKYLGIGYLKPKYNIYSLKDCKNSRSVSRAVFNQFDHVVDFVDKYPMLTRKQLDYIDWKEIIELKKQDAHYTVEGKETMLKLKLGMNRGRFLNSNSFNSADKIKIIKSIDND
jgi:hypothetical protein